MQDSREKILSLCRQLAAQQGLNDQAREEMCGHLEDKLDGYLNGAVKITEEDALILARAHFGDTEKVAGQIAAARTGIDSWLSIMTWAVLAIVAIILTPQIIDAMSVVLGILGGISALKIWRSEGQLGRQLRSTTRAIYGLAAVAIGPAMILPALAQMKQHHASATEVLGPLIFGAAVFFYGFYLIALGAARKLARRA